MSENDFKGFAKAQSYKGGFEQWVYDEIKALRLAVENIDGADTSELETAISNLEMVIGDESKATSIIGRIKALEDAS